MDDGSVFCGLSGTHGWPARERVRRTRRLRWRCGLAHRAFPRRTKRKPETGSLAPASDRRLQTRTLSGESADWLRGRA